MLQITPHHRILLAIKPVDFRKGIDGLKAICQSALDQDPYSGTIFAFRSNARTAVKLLIYDGNGFWLCHKRFSEGRLAFWPDSVLATKSLRSTDLAIILAQGDPSVSNIPDEWRKIIA